MAANCTHTLISSVTPLFLPLPTAPTEWLFIGAVFIGAMAILFEIHPTAVLGVTYLVLIMYVVDVLGPHPLLAVMIIVSAAIARVAGLGGEKLRTWVGEAGPDTLVAIAGLVQHFGSTRGGDCEDD